MARWVTRKQIRVNRLATAWLIRRFVDPQAELLFVEPGEVAGVQAREGATGFDAPGARFGHEGGVTSFEQLIAARGLDDPVLHDLARIVHAADVPGKLDQAPEAAGLRAISHGFPLVTGDDHDTLARGSIVYDALYAHLAARRAVPDVESLAVPAGARAAAQDLGQCHERDRQERAAQVRLAPDGSGWFRSR